MRRHAIASIRADGIGPEVISAGLDVLAALAGRSGLVRRNLFRRGRAADARG